MDNPARLIIDNGTFTNGDLYAVREGDAVLLSVAEEKAMDSYNEEFECTCRLDLDQAERLRDWLSSVLTSTVA